MTRGGAGEQNMANAEGHGGKSVAVAVADIEHEPHAEVDLDADMRRRRQTGHETPRVVLKNTLQWPLLQLFKNLTMRNEHQVSPAT